MAACHAGIGNVGGDAAGGDGWIRFVWIADCHGAGDATGGFGGFDGAGGGAYVARGVTVLNAFAPPETIGCGRAAP
jgi:hypothetical protein